MHKSKPEQKKTKPVGSSLVVPLTATSIQDATLTHILTLLSPYISNTPHLEIEIKLGSYIHYSSHIRTFSQQAQRSTLHTPSIFRMRLAEHW